MTKYQYQKIIFTRHAEYVQEIELLDAEKPISTYGFVQIDELKKNIFNKAESFLGIYYNSIRSQSTVIWCLGEKCHESKQDERLNYYLPISNLTFKSELLKAEGKNKILSFLVNESDDLLVKSDKIFSSYGVNASKISSLILDNLAKNNEKNVLACGREFLLSCFRAKLTSIVLGDYECQKYVLRYESMRLKHSTLEMYLIKIYVNNIGYKLKDWYGEINFDENHLIKLAEFSCEPKSK